VYSGNSVQHGSCTVDVWSDAHFANEAARHSPWAYLFRLNGSIISWQSRRQKTVSVSTEEAEITAASEAAREANALRLILQEIGLTCHSDKLVLHVDNSPAVHAISNPGYYCRLKHLDVQQKFVMELYKDKVFSVECCRTADILADRLSHETE
jgi:hypothetical protein